MLSQLRYQYRFRKLKKILRRYQDIKIVIHSDPPDYALPLQLTFRGQYQLGIYLNGPEIDVYVYSGQASTFVVAHLVQALMRVGKLNIRGVYSYKEALAPAPPTKQLDRFGKLKRQLKLVKDVSAATGNTPKDTNL